MLGFWEFDSQFDKLVNRLIDILKINDTQLIGTQHKENILSVSVKYFILRIINTVIDFKLDGSTKKLTLKFKQLH